MGVYIRGMEMPKSCWECRFNSSTIDHREACLLTNKTYNWGLTTPPSDCPLVPVPPHGDLIDRDALIKAGWSNLHKEVMRMGGYAIHELPLKNPSISVIIPAEEGE